jgi:UDP-N-acetylglucosamine 2-epimerase (non-hydrolysing)
MLVAGTRPEAIKLAPVFWWLEKIGVDYVFLWSGQHYDYEMSRVFFEQLKLPEPDVFLDVGVQASNVSEQVGLLIQKITSEVKKIQPRFVYALGDTNTTLATALASVHVSKPFVHDEAGVRSFDMTMLEEVNRRVADAVADLRLASSKLAVVNLLYEGVPRSSIRLVGSTAVDTLIYIVSNKLQKEEVLSELRVEPDSFILVTLHRRENLVDERLHLAISALVEIARAFPDFKIVFPVHPHTRKRLEELRLYRRLERDNVVFTKPLGYLEFVALLQAARAVITDSGGVQEEAFVLGKRIVTLRRTTEWIETVVLGYNQLVGLDDVGEVVKGVVAAIEGRPLPVPDLIMSPLGDGRAGRRVAKILQTLLESGIERRRDEFKIPILTKEGSDVSLCFSADGFPVVENVSTYCISRERIIPETLRAVIEVNWEEVDRRM